MPRTIPILLCTALLTSVPASALAKGPLREPDEGPDPRGLTLSGSGVARVKAPTRRSEQTIEQAIAAARPQALSRALEQARVRARALAAGAGLTLGDVRAVTEREAEDESGFGELSRHCDGRGRRCRVPALTVATLTVTFATAETSTAAPAGRAIVASGSASAPVRPRNRRRDDSIRQALFTARLAAAPGALAAARRDAEETARAAGIELGPLGSIAEVRRPFEDFAFGSFGPGRFCGTTVRPVFRRDPATGRRRVVRRVRQRRCFYPREAAVVLRVTFLPR